MKSLVAVGLIPPVLVLIVSWIVSHLTERLTPQLLLKSFAWFFSLFLFLTFIFEFTYITSPTFVGLFFGPGAPFPWGIVVMAMVFLVLPYVFFAMAVLPAYKRLYDDSALLASHKQLGVLYIIAFGVYLFLTGPLIGDILGALT